MRCTTRRGRLQCEYRAGHAGECVTSLSTPADAAYDHEAERDALRLAVQRLHAVLRDIREGDEAKARASAAIGVEIAESALSRSDARHRA